MDDLSFIWCDRGADILADSGRYGYIGKTEQGSGIAAMGIGILIRDFYEFTRAHNT